MSRLAARIARLEPKAAIRRPPHHVTIKPGETEASALARFRQRWPKLPRNHHIVVSPPPMSIDEWRRLAAAKAEQPLPLKGLPHD